MPTTTHLEAEEIVRALQRGDYDDRLDEIHQALQARRERAARVLAAGLSPGDTIHFSDKTHPRYLVGLPATVVRVNQQSVTVSVPEAPEYRKFAGSDGMRVPNNLIQELAT